MIAYLILFLIHMAKQTAATSGPPLRNIAATPFTFDTNKDNCITNVTQVMVLGTEGIFVGGTTTNYKFVNSDSVISNCLSTPVPFLVKTNSAASLSQISKKQFFIDPRYKDIAFIKRIQYLSQTPGAFEHLDNYFVVGLQAKAGHQHSLLILDEDLNT